MNDEQFREAVRGFADKDSPALRAASAAVLGQIGTRDALPARGYLSIVTDQLPAALQLESESVVLLSIVGAIRALAAVESRDLIAAQAMLERTYWSNINLRRRFMINAGKFLLAAGFQPQSSRWPQVALMEIVARSGFRCKSLSRT
jgi:hypothetical protein